jgi:hypothetical protein
MTSRRAFIQAAPNAGADRHGPRPSRGYGPITGGDLPGRRSPDGRTAALNRPGRADRPLLGSIEALALRGWTRRRGGGA